MGLTVAIVTPWHNQHGLWPDYRDAVLAAGADDHVIVVDNASDPPLEWARITSPTNLGFSAASNLGLRAASTDVVLFLNNDVVALRDTWLKEIREAVEPGVIVGPMRTDQHTVVDSQLYPYIDGWCLAGMRDELVALGGFDESLEEPAYYSDNLLCLAARRSGMTLRDVRVGLHHKEGTTARHSPRMHQAAVINRQKYENTVRGVPAAT